MKDHVHKIIDQALREGRAHLLEPEAKQVCREYGMTTPAFRLASNLTDALKKARSLGFPVVLKVVSPDIIHKTEAGGVALGLRSTSDVRPAYSKILTSVRRYAPKAKVLGVLVERMALQGTEVIIGGLRDPQFGPTIMFGLGGVFVEVFKDVSFRVAPLRETDARKMVREIKGYQILKGHRGQRPVDERNLIDIILSISKLMTDCPEISEMDLNPTIANDKGAIVADARISLVKQPLPQL